MNIYTYFNYLCTIIRYKKMKSTFQRFLVLATAVTATVSCTNSGKVPAIDSANLDTSVAPGEDFYQYATGGWQKNNPLKPEYSRYGSFDVLAENNEIKLNELFKTLADTKAEAGSVEQKIADLYLMGLDSTRLNNEGAAPLLKYIAELDSIGTEEDFAIASAWCEKHGVTGLYSIGVDADLANSDNEILYIGESGLKMRNRDYYLLPEHEGLRNGFKAYLGKIFALAGVEDAEQAAQDAYDVEMAIAVPFWSMVQQRDVEAAYNPVSTEKLVALYPHLHLDSFFGALSIPAQDKLILEQPSYFEAIDGIVGSTSPVKLKHYLQGALISRACEFLDDEFYEAYFDFFSRQISGVKEQKPRWKRAMNIPNSLLDQAVGKMYVSKYFPEADKERVLNMVRNIQTALGQHIAGLDWMSEETKAKAQEKLAAFRIKIGYPDEWKDYSSLVIDSGSSYLDNIMNASEWAYEDNISKLGKTVDRNEWLMPAQMVNAYYNPTTNEICFPAGILQPPFYNSDADDAVNYGAIGVVISHEMTHGLDDQGRLFDKDGNLNNWWTENEEKAFKQKTALLVDQFNKVEVLPGVYANGEATLGENIADQGGLRISYTAMQNSFNGKHPADIDGFTAEQRFYLAYAGVWAQNITDEEIQRRTLVDVHSIGENRVNVSVRNLQSFFDAFGITEGDKMWRPEEERVIIW